MAFLEPGSPTDHAAAVRSELESTLGVRRRGRRTGAGPGQPDRRAHRLQRRPGPPAGAGARDVRRRGAARRRPDPRVQPPGGRRLGGPRRGPGPGHGLRLGGVRRRRAVGARRGRRRGPRHGHRGRHQRPGRRRAVQLGGPRVLGRASRVASLLDLPLDADGRRALAAACMRAESEVAGAPTGGMDQTISLLAEEGSALLIDFDDDETAQVRVPDRRGRSGPPGHRHPGLARPGRGRVRRPPGRVRRRGAPARCRRRCGTPRWATWRTWPTTACSDGPGTSSPRSPGWSVRCRRSRPATGRAWDGCSTSPTSRCATTSRSPAPSSTRAVADRGRGRRDRRPDDRRRVRRLVDRAGARGAGGRRRPRHRHRVRGRGRSRRRRTCWPRRSAAADVVG